MKSLAMFRAAGFLLLLLLLSSQLSAGNVVRFFAFGDLPYSAAEDEMLAAMLADVSKEGPEFLVHVGDVKGGASPCTARALGRMAQLFKEQAVPVVYTPGDNEWTDCHRPEAGGYDPLERLSVLRLLYFGNDDVLRLSELRVFRENAAYPENYWFVVEGVFFATVHVVGSDNNANRGDAEAADEAMARSRSNREHLRAAVEVANAVDASAFVLLLHADPGFEMPVSPHGFGLFREDLTGLLRDYSGPVLAVHGDTHMYRYDHPLRDPDTGRTIQRFTRLEVPGSPLVGGVWVSVTPGAAKPFAVELTYPDPRDQLIER